MTIMDFTFRPASVRMNHRHCGDMTWPSARDGAYWGASISVMTGMAGRLKTTWTMTAGQIDALRRRTSPAISPATSAAGKIIFIPVQQREGDGSADHTDHRSVAEKHIGDDSAEQELLAYAGENPDEQGRQDEDERVAPCDGRENLLRIGIRTRQGDERDDGQALGGKCDEPSGDSRSGTASQYAKLCRAE